MDLLDRPQIFLACDLDAELDKEGITDFDMRRPCEHACLLSPQTNPHNAMKCIRDATTPAAWLRGMAEGTRAQHSTLLIMKS